MKAGLIKFIFALFWGLIFVCGLVLRVWHLDFGLPHSFYADEPEIGEWAIRYAYEIKRYLGTPQIVKLAPENYVYGTFPVYLYFALVSLFSKILNLLHINFSKTDLYIYMRLINALISLGIVLCFYWLVIILYPNANKFVRLFSLFLVSLNWKLIVHAHYLNHDILLTFLLLLSNIYFYKYLKSCKAKTPESDTINVTIFSIFYGLAVSTKITAIITLPIYFLFMFINKSYRSIFASFFIIVIVSIITNPFSWVFMDELFLRMLEMGNKEAGVVFDSFDLTKTKYIKALSYTLTAPVFVFSVAGIFMFLRLTKNKDETLRFFYFAVLLQIIFYLIFFSTQKRRVDRWLLPILPNLSLFFIFLLNEIEHKRHKIFIHKTIRSIVFVVIALYYCYFPFILTKQFTRHTPKSSAYIWAKENLPPESLKFAITEEGLDPLNKLPNSTVWQFNVYESEGAQLMYPPNPNLFDYIFISSRPMAWTKNPYVTQKYKNYAQKWLEFEKNLNDANKFLLIKEFSNPKPNLIPLSDVYIYKRVN